MKPKVVDLFCGAGGLSLGLTWAGFEIAAANDYDPDSCATYRANHTRADVVCGDITAADVFEELVAKARCHGEIDLVVGGPPCQGFTQMRNFNRFIDDPRNRLYRQFVAVIKELRPRAFLMENVPGLREFPGVADQIIEDLRMSGDYVVDAPRVLEAADFGVPQGRRRLFFLGVRRDVAAAPLWPEGQPFFASVDLVRRMKRKYAEYNVVAREQLDGRQLFPHAGLEELMDPKNLTFVSVSQAIGDLAGLAPGEGAPQMPRLAKPTSAYQKLMADSRELFNHDVPRMNADTATRLKHIPVGGNIRDLREEHRQRYLSGQKWGPDLGRSELSRQHFYAYRKLHPDFVSWTVNTKTDFAYHYQSKPRAITVREAARLQSFPDSFRFVVDHNPGRLRGGSRHSLSRQVGNAVPPLLAQAMGSALRKLLASRVRSTALRRAV